MHYTRKRKTDKAGVICFHARRGPHRDVRDARIRKAIRREFFMSICQVPVEILANKTTAFLADTMRKNVQPLAGKMGYQSNLPQGGQSMVRSRIPVLVGVGCWNPPRSAWHITPAGNLPPAARAERRIPTSPSLPAMPSSPTPPTAAPNTSPWRRKKAGASLQLTPAVPVHALSPYGARTMTFV